MLGNRASIVITVMLMLSVVAINGCVGASTPEKQPDFDGLIFVTPAMTDDLLLPTTLPDFRYRSSKISIFASPGEYEPATFSIYAMTDLQDVKVTAGTLKGDNGSIPDQAVDIRVVKCWYQGGNPGRPGDVTFLNPELLLKDNDFLQVDTEKKINILKSLDAPRDADTLQPANIPTNTLKQFWVTVQVPEDAAPGIYKGVIRIATADGANDQVKLAVEVLPIKLARPMLEYMIVHGAGRLDPTGQGECTKSRASEYVFKKSEAQYKAELQNLKAHGITQPMIGQDLVPNDDGSYNFTLLERAMTLVQEAGFGPIPLFYIPYGKSVGTQKTPDEIEELKKWAKGVIALSQKHGFTEAYFYGIAEAGGGFYGTKEADKEAADEGMRSQRAPWEYGTKEADEILRSQRAAWEAVHELGGKIYVNVYTGFFPIVGDLLDLNLYGSPIGWDVVEKMHQIGHKVYGMKNAPVETASRPFAMRCNYGLALWLEGFDGGCIFSYQFAHGNIYDDADSYNWDYVYAYPTVDGVIDTLQWEGWREAVDDIRYLTTLLKTIEEAKAGGEKKKELAKEAECWVKDLRFDMDAEKYYATQGGDNWFGRHGDTARGIDPRINFAGRGMQTIRREMAEWIIQLQGEENLVPLK